MKQIFKIRFIVLFIGIYFPVNLNAQILTFDFVGLAGSEATASSNFNNAGLTASTISRGVGLTASANADRFNATNWALTSIANAIIGNNYMEFTITPVAGNQFSVSSIVISLQRSGTGPSGIALRSSVDGYVTDLGGAQAIVDNTSTQTFTFTFTQNNACNDAVTYRIYMFAEATAGSGGPGDFTGNDIIVNGSVNACGAENCSDGIDNDGDGLIDGADPDCAPNTITTGIIAGSPFTVGCTVGVAVNVPFTSTGTFTAGNVYTAQLSNASGSFAIPLNIGTLTSTANLGTISATIPGGTATGTGYRIRVVSSTPAITGTDNGVDLTINGISPGFLVVNEMSNGETGVGAGTQEYTELLVVGTPCTTVSIQGLIFDDNNGDWTTGGVAAGHYRFTTDPQWGCIPVGSLIVIYNGDDRNATIPADDPTDANVDTVYILPHTSTLLEMCSTVPSSTGPVLTYTGCTYVTGTVWNQLGMANSGDCSQTRYEDGTFMHGIGYGGVSVNGVNADAAAGGGKVFYFTNAVSDDYTNDANFTSGSAADPGTMETPGAPNTAANATYINSLQCTILPVEFLSFSVVSAEKDVMLKWTTATEINSDYFIVERAVNIMEFIGIGRIAAAGYSNNDLNYEFIDENAPSGVVYYRLKQVDFDGKFKYSPIRVVRRMAGADPGIIGNLIDLSGCSESTTVHIMDISGKTVSNETVNNGFYSLENLNKGLYIIHVVCNQNNYIFKIGNIK